MEQRQDDTATESKPANESNLRVRFFLDKVGCQGGDATPCNCMQFILKSWIIYLLEKTRLLLKGKEDIKTKQVLKDVKL